MSYSRHLRWQVALSWIVMSTLVISGSVGSAIFYWHHFRAKRASDERYTIVAILQSSDSKEPLQTNFLAELLGLSIDQPVNLYTFNTKEAVQKLLAFPVIKSAEVKKVLPGMLQITYTLRKPLAYLVDYSNAAIDEEGWVFPSKPFYTPKNIPELVLGYHSALEWGEKIAGEKVFLAAEILKEVNEPIAGFNLKRIDVSKTFSPKLGEREIVLFFEDLITSEEDKNVSHRIISIIRFSPDNWQKQLVHLWPLLQKISGEPFVASQNQAIKRIIIDLRISSLAYVQGND